MILQLFVLYAVVTRLKADLMFCPTQQSPLEGFKLTYRWSKDEDRIIVRQSLARFTYDYALKKYSVKQDWNPETGIFSTWLIFDHGVRKLFAITGNKCTTSFLEVPFSHLCMPSDATVTFFKTTLGIPSSGPASYYGRIIPTGEYLYHTTGDSGVPNSSLVWDQRNPYFPTPVFQHVFSMDQGQLTVEAVHFLNLTNVADFTSLQPPPFCDVTTPPSHPHPTPNVPKW